MRCGSKLPAPPTMGKPNLWPSGLLSAPSLLSTSDVSPRHTVPVAGGELGICPSTSSMLDRDTQMHCQCPELGCAHGHNALDTKTCELCHELPSLPEPETVIVFCERDWDRKVSLIHASEVALPLRESSKTPWNSTEKMVWKVNQ